MRKIFSFSSLLTGISTSLHSMVLPLFINDSLNNGNLTIDDASQKLIGWVRYYLFHFSSSSTEADSLYTICVKYFDDIKKGSLYNTSDLPSINRLLIKIADSLPSTDLYQGSSVPVQKLDLFLSSLQNRRCADQHRDQLRKIVRYDILNQFDQPIQKIIADLIYRMESQISLTIESWDKSVFSGFYDSQSVHSEHILYLLLDDLFGISGHTLSSENDILLRRTSLARCISQASFQDKFTLSHLLSDGSENWELNFSNLVSSSSVSSLSLSIQDLANSHDLLSFFVHRRYLTDYQKDLIINSADPFSEDNHVIDFPWLSFSDVVGEEKIQFHSIFSTIFFEYVYTKLSTLLSVDPSLSSTVDSTSLIPVDSIVERKLIDEYFLGNVPKQPFSLEQILHAMQSDLDRSEYHCCFLKSQLKLSTFMMAHCNPNDVLFLFNEFLFPNRHQLWVLDCLSLMLANNIASAIHIPSEKWKFFVNNHNESVLKLFASRHSSSFYKLIKAHPEFIPRLASFVDKDGTTLLHWIVIFDAYPLVNILFDYPEFFDVLSRITEKKQNASIFHWLSNHHGDSLVRLVTHNVSLLYRLHHIVDSYGSTPFNWLAQYSPDHFLSLVRSVPVFLDLLLNESDSKNTPVHWFVFFHPTLLFKLYDLAPEKILSFRGKRKETLFHQLAYLHPNVFCENVSKLPFSVLNLLVDTHNKSPFDYLHIHHSSHFNHLVSHVPQLASIAHALPS